MEIVTKKRALNDPVLKPFIERATNELTFHGRVRFAPVIKALDQLKPHRQFIHDHIQIVRKVLEDTFGPLTPINSSGTYAGGKGRGSHTVGFVRAVEKFSEIIDESLERKQGVAVGIKGAHNELADIISDQTGEERSAMKVEVEAPPLPPPPELLPEH